ncbi:hypothetical protein JQ543_28230 [Bradyrhizobium diazoefficiens]|nr:hypothetical protein [Bradyrhizobium diazoefficiens]MBR0851659.1 hypothetical protein [Bradyrhizobium diazoefficiens]
MATTEWSNERRPEPAIFVENAGCQNDKLVNREERLMDNARRYRALASLCREQAAYRPLQNWQLLGQAEHFEYLAVITSTAHSDA